MRENYITRLRRERDELHTAFANLRDNLIELEIYLTSPKFTISPDHDYVHVRTDILPKIAKLRSIAMVPVLNLSARHEGQDQTHEQG